MKLILCELDGKDVGELTVEVAPEVGGTVEVNGVQYIVREVVQIDAGEAVVAVEFLPKVTAAPTRAEGAAALEGPVLTIAGGPDASLASVNPAGALGAEFSAPLVAPVPPVVPTEPADAPVGAKLYNATLGDLRNPHTGAWFRTNSDGTPAEIDSWMTSQLDHQPPLLVEVVPAE